jgi:hypothetical protein
MVDSNGLNEARQWQRKYAASRFVAVDLPTLTQLRAADESSSPLVECQRSEAIVRLRATIVRLPERYSCGISKISASPKSLGD